VLLSFYALCPRAQEYHRQLQERRLNPRIHIAKIMALSEIYGPDKVARALEDAFEFAAFSSDYIANILEQRERLTVRPGPLHLTRRQDLLDVELAPVDISIYDPRILEKQNSSQISQIFLGWFCFSRILLAGPRKLK
jgi:hypothetical protein